MIFFERQTAYDCFSPEDHWNATERGYPMVNFTLRKLLGMIPMLLIITFLIYAGIELMPGDVIDFLIPMDQLAEMTAEEVAHNMSLTRERVRQIKERALRRLRETDNINILVKYLG